MVLAHRLVLWRGNKTSETGIVFVLRWKGEETPALKEQALISLLTTCTSQAHQSTGCSWNKTRNYFRSGLLRICTKTMKRLCKTKALGLYVFELWLIPLSKQKSKYKYKHFERKGFFSQIADTDAADYCLWQQQTTRSVRSVVLVLPRRSRCA